MDNQLEQLIEVNIKGRVFTICKSHGVTDPTIMGYYTGILDQAVRAKLSDDAGPREFNHVLEEQAEWLESEITQTSTAEAQEASAENTNQAGGAGETKQPRKSSGYVPNAKTMPERLADQRSGMEHLLENECVTLKLVTPKQAKMMKRRLLGQEPEKAQQELVAELRNVLHQQVRDFIRKNNGGPWSSATLQHELRMDIVTTRTLRSLVTLARELLFEREEWVKKNKVSLTDRLFGGKVRFKR